MGNPQNYSTELPDRCLALIDGLWREVQSIEEHHARYGGPLTSTSLLAMATPVVVMPVERILKQGETEGLADDRMLNESLSVKVAALNSENTKFRDVDFFDQSDGWTYAYSENLFNIARGMPEALVSSLGADAAQDAAADLKCSVVLKVIRNALSHGVVGFLDSDGRSTYGQISTMMAFIGEERVRGRAEGLHILRISEVGFRSFLRRWVHWLNESGMAQELAA